MLFPTITFAVFFLLVYVANWLLMPRLRLWKWFIIAVSYVFYGWWDWRFVLLLVAATFVNQALGVQIARARALRGGARAAKALAGALGARQPRGAGLFQVRRLLRRQPRPPAQQHRARRAAASPAHPSAGGHLVPRVPRAHLHHRHLPRRAGAGLHAGLRRVRGLLPVPARGPHRAGPRLPAAAELAARPAQRRRRPRLHAHSRRPRQEAPDRRLPVDAHRQWRLRLAAVVLVLGDPLGDPRLLGADLLRLQRLQRYRHRHRAAPRLRAARELQRPVHGAHHPGFLATLAHHAVQLAARLPVHPAGRQPQGARAHVR